MTFIRAYLRASTKDQDADRARADLEQFATDKGLRIAALKSMRADESIANQHYAEHTDKPFFGELVSFITGGTLVAMVLEGSEAVKAARQLIGATNPVEAAPGSIRGDFALEVTFNMVHGTDSDESAEREIGIWFPELS